jgi:hypothetical protein
MKYTSVHTNIDEKLLWPEIKAQQDIYLKPILGTKLFDKVLADITAGTIADNYLILLESYIIPCLCNYVLAELPEGLNYQFWNRGLVQNNTTTVNNISVSEMYSIMSKYKSRAEHYGAEMKRYIEANKALFPEYFQSVTGADLRPDTGSYECPIVL